MWRRLTRGCRGQPSLATRPLLQNGLVSPRPVFVRGGKKEKQSHRAMKVVCTCELPEYVSQGAPSPIPGVRCSFGRRR